MAQHSRDILGQLQSAIIEISVLKSENKRQAKLIKDQAAQIILITKFFEERIVKLSEEIDRLRKQINTDSTNSSLPPSQDQKPNKIFNGREKSGKKSGGQSGHPGHFLNKADIENKIKQGLIASKIVNHGQGTHYTSKYTIGLKTEIVVTEHRFYDEIPLAFRPDVQYDDGIKAFAATLVGRGIVASNRIVELIASITNDEIKLSDGSIYNWLKEFDTKAASTIKDIETNLLNSPNLNVDETGARCEGKNMCARNYSTENYVRYTMNSTKAMSGIEKDGILPNFVGTAIHDHNTAYYNYGARNAECNVHSDRYLKGNSENTENKWSDDMRTLLNSSNKARKLAKGQGEKQFTQEVIETYQNKYDEILTLGFLENKETKSRYDKKEELKLLRRLKKYKSNHLLYLEDFTVPFDNNLSERDLRTFKTKMKVSGCFRSLTGGKYFATLLSVIKTATKQNRSPYHAVKEIFAL